MAASWLASVNWDQVGKAAGSVGSAASAITQAAKDIKGLKSNPDVVTTTNSGGDSGTPLLLLAALFLLRGF